MAEKTDLTMPWRRASRCGNTTCVEVARVGNQFLVRDSKSPEQNPLQFTAQEWEHFAEAVKDGEFDFG